MRRLREFVKAAGERGWPSMIGTAIFVIAALVEHFRDRNLTSFVFIFLAAAIFCWGAFKAWRDADKEVSRLSQEIASRLPDVDIEVRAGYLDAGKCLNGEKWEDVDRGCSITLYICATNRNEQQAFFHYAPALTCRIYGQEYAGQWRHISPTTLTVNDEVLKGDRRLIDFMDQRYIPDGFTMYKGRPLYGWVMFYLEWLDKDLLFAKNEIKATVSLSMRDTLKGVHSSVNTVSLKVNAVCATATFAS